MSVTYQVRLAVYLMRGLAYLGVRYDLVYQEFTFWLDMWEEHVMRKIGFDG